MSLLADHRIDAKRFPKNMRSRILSFNFFFLVFFFFFFFFSSFFFFLSSLPASSTSFVFYFIFYHPGIYEIDDKVKKLSKLKTFEKPVDRLVPKNSKKKAASEVNEDLAQPQPQPQPPLPLPVQTAPPQPVQGSQAPAAEVPDLSLVRSGHKVMVKGFTIESRLRAALSDPVILDLLLFGKGREDGIVQEFRDTPFAAQPGKFSAFTRIGTSFGILELRDDFMFSFNGQSCIGRAMGFCYKADLLEKEVFPCVKAFVYRRNARDEVLLDVTQLWDIKVSTVTQLVQVSKDPLPGKIHCQAAMQGQHEVEFNPEAHQQERLSVFQGDIEVNRETQLYISIFYDSYTSAPTRYKSVGGLYMTIMNMVIKHQKKPENVFLLSLVPSGADYFQVWEIYRQELVRLQDTGFEAVHAKSGQTVQHKVRVSNKKADAPQRNEDCDHQSGNADLFCCKCGGRKKDLWDFDFPVFRHHHHPGFVDVIKRLKANLQPAEFEVVRT